MSSENAILSHFSLPVILRQFFCGVVFFLPTLLAWGGDVKALYALLKPESSVVLGVGIVLSCIIGTIIHHLEKNTYHYALQGLFCVVGQCFAECDRKCCGLLVIVALAAMCILMWVCYNTCLCLFFILLTLLLVVTLTIFHVPLVSITQKLWVISAVEVMKKEEFNVGNYACERYAVLKRLDTWSDNIHCVQACCFAWILGIALAKFLANQAEVIGFVMNICSSSMCVNVCTEPSPAQSQLQCFEGWSVGFAFAILFWEACFEWHRFQHIYAITKNMSFMDGN